MDFLRTFLGIRRPFVGTRRPFLGTRRPIWKEYLSKVYLRKSTNVGLLQILISGLDRPSDYFSPKSSNFLVQLVLFKKAQCSDFIWGFLMSLRPLSASGGVLRFDSDSEEEETLNRSGSEEGILGENLGFSHEDVVEDIEDGTSSVLSSSLSSSVSNECLAFRAPWATPPTAQSELKLRSQVQNHP